MSNLDSLWQTKLHARMHDPAEKALVLLRDPAGHEGGTVEVLHRLLGYRRMEAARLENDNAEVLHAALFKHGIPGPIYDTVRRADWWAAAADRPQWPMTEITVTTRKGETRTLAVAPHAQVRWTRQPVLIHPLTGAELDLAIRGQLGSSDLDELKSRSFEHFASLVQRTDDQEVDWHRTLLAYWRFGPELSEERDSGKLGALWPLLPADTRVPDHSIWDHLDLTSAFAGAFHTDADGEAALLTVSLGPVQSFIASARSTSDLWAGSHLLSRLAWEAIRPVCDALGPDAVLFPRLRGVPQVDLWLRDQCQLPHALFADAAWTARNTDANPLFAAALPNRFVALVPRSQAADLARRCEAAVRDWLQTLGNEVVDRLLAEAGLPVAPGHAHGQMRAQLQDFPEVHWAAVPFSLIRPRNAEKQTDLDTTALSEAMAPFFGVAASQAAGFLDTPAWHVLSKATRWDDATTFFAPNPGALYPAVYDLAERALAAAKSTRSFAQSEQLGWRCSLTGETEWLTIDPQQLALPPGQRRDTLWTRLQKRRPAWAKSGEHLGALPAIKRLWPSLFAEEVAQAVARDDGQGSGAANDAAQRFVVSTHTMALAHQLQRWLEGSAPGHEALQKALDGDRTPERTALPRKLARDYRGRPGWTTAQQLPGALDAAGEESDDEDGRSRSLRHAARDALCRDGSQLETYYAMLMMDGDRMGAWLSGGDDYSITYRGSFHPTVRAGFDAQAQRQKLLQQYGSQYRAVSPNRHLAISAALNDFSLKVAPHVIEQEYLGRLIYSGGDDVLAMLPVADLLPAMQRLRVAYSGHDPSHEEGDRSRLSLRNGFAWLPGRTPGQGSLLRMMGERATASCGAIVAHHQAPLGSVMRELRAAEKRAKDAGGRDAFSLTIVKRSGGALHLTAKWGEPLELLHALRRFLGHAEVSRRAVYNSLEWMADLPQNDEQMLAAMLAYQLDRQAGGDARKVHRIPDLARRLARLAFDDAQRPAPCAGEARLGWLAHFMSAAEFLAREVRSTD